MSLFQNSVQICKKNKERANKFFENVAEFQYFGMVVTYRNYINEEVER
jgi:hypothetical protein